ncbi:MAG: metallophosphoesterase [Candidatus Hodarchaeota archaeon]
MASAKQDSWVKVVMRIAAVSDIHVRPGKQDDDLLNAIHERVEEISPDVFLVAGDVGSKLEELKIALEKIRISRALNLFVAGNHDIWFEKDKNLSSLEKYSSKIGSVCRDSGFVHLPDEPISLDAVAFVGSIGWYDYSFRRNDLNIPHANYERKEYRGTIWYDALAVDWEFTDYEATDLFNQKIQYDLSVIEGSVEGIIYVSHHVPFRVLISYKDFIPWDFCSAFMGAISTGDILLEDERVLLAISGHTHIRKRGKVGGILGITVPLGYCRPQDANLESFVNAAVADIEIRNKEITIHRHIEGDICNSISNGYSW